MFEWHILVGLELADVCSQYRDAIVDFGLPDGHVLYGAFVGIWLPARS